MLNIYGPYNHRKYLWDKVVRSGALNDPSLIIAGDLNFILSTSNVRGSGDHFDP